VSDPGAAFPNAGFAQAVRVRLEPLLPAGVPLKPGAVELIEVLGRSGMPMAVATSMKRAEAMHHLELHGLGRFFRVIVGRDDVANGKPHPDVHLKLRWIWI
jgi:beta-phosphoglucomutase-like phosphatase (HAD superfamily)